MVSRSSSLATTKAKAIGHPVGNALMTPAKKRYTKVVSYKRFLGYRERFIQVRANQEGQATAEYALVILGAAAVALLVVAWASGTDKIGKLFDFIVDNITRSVS